MAKANIVQISDAWMTVVNVGRVLKMTKQEAKKMQKELSDYKKGIFEIRREMQPRSVGILAPSFVVRTYYPVKC